MGLKQCLLRAKQVTYLLYYTPPPFFRNKSQEEFVYGMCTFISLKSMDFITRILLTYMREKQEFRST